MSYYTAFQMNCVNGGKSYNAGWKNVEVTWRNIEWRKQGVEEYAWYNMMPFYLKIHKTI